MIASSTSGQDLLRCFLRLRPRMATVRALPMVALQARLDAMAESWYDLARTGAVV